ncbi:MAG: helix-turn-helix transcriptional regulator [Dehalococcoidia bacterium]|nr:helix-turn-helix transcriptional regulator [Dehalococcoidia bacterium]
MDATPQYCPVAMAIEVVADRWALLILRELIVGAHTFGEIHSGIPHISRTLLSERLKQLAGNGLLQRREDQPGRPKYWLTPAGEDLQDIIFGLGEWAIRWAYFTDPEDSQLDNTHLMWRFRRGVIPDRVPGQRVVVEFVLTGPGGAIDHVWLVITPSGAEACLKPPGFDVDMEVRTSSRELHRIWLGRTSISEAIRARTLELIGPAQLTRTFPRWFTFSPFAPVIRRAQATPA